MLDFSIPQPTAPFVDSKTGMINLQWFLFLNNLFQSPTGTVTAVTASSPLSSSGGNTPDISWGVIGASNFPVLTGDVTTPGGSLTTTLKNTGTAGTYTKTTFDAQGRETAGASAVLASADFVNQGTVHTLLHGNAAGNPSFGAVDLTDEVTGILPYTNGGTNNSTSGSGNWTPSDTSGAGLSLIINSQAKYFKLGLGVLATFSITYPSTVDVTANQIGGLPFTASVSGNSAPVIISVTTLGVSITGLVLDSSTNFTFANLAGSQETNAQLSGKVFRGAALYIATT